MVPDHTEYYTDLSQTYLYLKFRILRSNGTNLEADKKVAPINNFFHSMFSGIDLYLNNKLVTSNMDTYPFRAYIENLVLFGSDVKAINLKLQNFGTKMSQVTLKILIMPM